MYISNAIKLAFVAISVAVNSGAAEDPPTRKPLKGGDGLLRKGQKNPKPVKDDVVQKHAGLKKHDEPDPALSKPSLASPAKNPTENPTQPLDTPMYLLPNPGDGSFSMQITPEFNEWGVYDDLLLFVPMSMEAPQSEESIISMVMSMATSEIEESMSMIGYEELLESVSAVPAPLSMPVVEAVGTPTDVVAGETSTDVVTSGGDEDAAVDTNVDEDEEAVSDDYDVTSVSAENITNVDGDKGVLNPSPFQWISSTSSTVYVSSVNALLVCCCVISAFVC